MIGDILSRDKPIAIEVKSLKRLIRVFEQFADQESYDKLKDKAPVSRACLLLLESLVTDWPNCFE